MACRMSGGDSILFGLERYSSPQSRHFSNNGAMLGSFFEVGDFFERTILSFSTRDLKSDGVRFIRKTELEEILRICTTMNCPMCGTFIDEWRMVFAMWDEEKMKYYGRDFWMCNSCWDVHCLSIQLACRCDIGANTMLKHVLMKGKQSHGLTKDTLN